MKIVSSSPERFRIALAAPTGKAAARLQEAIKTARQSLDCPEAVKARIPEGASTIHRLLGSIPGSPYFRHDDQSPLAVDVLVVDEASMVDLPLMSKLLQALPKKARLILLGDKDQLSSVEAGAVLGDICETGEEAFYSPAFAAACRSLCGCRLESSRVARPLGVRKPKDCLVELKKSYRFSGESGIALLSRAVRNGDGETAIAVLRSRSHPDLSWNDPPSGANLSRAIRGEVIEGYRGYLEEAQFLAHHPPRDPQTKLQEIFRLFENFRILCAVREGPLGVATANHLVENILEEARLLTRTRRWYVGRPVLIRRNDYSLRLFNGDIGLCLPQTLLLPEMPPDSGTPHPSDPSDPLSPDHSPDAGPSTAVDYRVFFTAPDGRFRSFHPQRLPEHETVYAMTVHKSQGSEFDNVLFILPDRESRILTRELVYTAITRARKRVSVLGTERILRSAVSHATRRLSGLSDALWRE